MAASTGSSSRAAGATGRRHDVVVVGAGIVGVCTAWHLLRLGKSVALIDRGAPGLGCSFGNAGALSSGSVAPLAMPGIARQALSMLLDPAAPLHVPPQYWLAAAPWLLRFLQASRPAEVQRIAGALATILEGTIDHHRQMLAEAGAPELVEVTGQLHLYRDEHALYKDEPAWQLRRRHGLAVQRLGRAGIDALEPDVSPAYRLAMFTPEQGMSINPYRHVTALADDFARRGGSIICDDIRSIDVVEGRVTGVRGTAGVHPARDVVVAAGAWSAALLRPFGYRVPLETQRGYHVTVPNAGVAVRRPVIAADRKVFITPMETGLRVAGTVEFGGLERKPTRRRAALLVDDLGVVFPTARVPQDWTLWMGHRPCLPDSLPVMGAAPGHPGLWLNLGHGHLGLTMSAKAGHTIAALLSGQPSPIDMQPFAIARFEKRGAAADFPRPTALSGA